jgi:hypothetical protein
VSPAKVIRWVLSRLAAALSPPNFFSGRMALRAQRAKGIREASTLAMSTAPPAVARMISWFTCSASVPVTPCFAAST